tara:strand:+ start:13072 stop:13659 length:588 start_codon:yes stop_codon:yes gene_type:complete
MIRPDDIFLDTSGSLLDQLRSSSQQTINDIVVALGVTTENEAVRETSKSGNAVTLANGDFGGWSGTVSGTIFKGMGASARADRTISLSEDCVIDGVHLIGGSKNKGSLASISVGATVVFRNCIFEKRAGDAGAHVTLGAPSASEVARAIFVGCVFQGPNLGSVITNPGIAGDVQMVACYDRTGGGYGVAVQTGSF